VSGFTISEIEPRLFSFNNPFGACPTCDGLGTTLAFEEDLVVPDHTLSLREGAVLPWAKTGSTSPYYTQTLEALCRHFDVSMATPWKDLTGRGSRGRPMARHRDQGIEFVYDDGVRSYKTEKPFEGVIGNIERRWRETESTWVREELARFQSDHACPACQGFRLKPEALAGQDRGLRQIGTSRAFSIRDAARLVRCSLPEKLNDKQTEIAGRILKEIRERLKFLNDVGLEYLTLSRPPALCPAAKVSASVSPRRSAPA
jgi:excinuclease ABC subunit A